MLDVRGVGKKRITLNTYAVQEKAAALDTLVCHMSCRCVFICILTPAPTVPSPPPTHHAHNPPHDHPHILKHTPHRTRKTKPGPLRLRAELTPPLIHHPSHHTTTLTNCSQNQPKPNQDRYARVLGWRFVEHAEALPDILGPLLECPFSEAVRHYICL